MIQVEGLTKYYGHFKAVDNLSFTVRQGEILGFLGPNGAGKTTTMRILTGYMPASDGHCRIGGDDVFDSPLATKKKIGYLPENVPLYPELTVSEFLLFVGRIKGIPAAALPAALERILGRCGLTDVGQKLISKLSKGYRQRVGLAQAMIHDPQVIILDEPTIGLDPVQIREVRELIRGLGGAHTIILSSHILPEVSQVCDRVLIINKGHIVAEDTPENLTRSAAGTIKCECLVRGREEWVRSVFDNRQLLDTYTLAPAPGEHMWHCTFQLTDGETRPVVARHLLEANLELFEFFSRQASLEDVFLQLTTEEIRTLDSDHPALSEPPPADSGPPPAEEPTDSGEVDS